LVKDKFLELTQGYAPVGSYESCNSIAYYHGRMKPKRNLFKMYSKYGLEGYYIPVRNSFSNTIEREFIPLKAKEIFEKKFGDRLITDTEFLDWYSENSVNFQ
jgi:hypothetical protein